MICMLPWVSFTVTMNDTIRPCCRFSMSSGWTLDDHPDAFEQIRKDMLDGKKIPQCKKCYEEEKVNVPSMRMRANEFHNLEDRLPNLDLNFKQLEHIEISLDNICNYQCRMCDSKFSSKNLIRDIHFNSKYPFLEMYPSKVSKSRYEEIKNLDIDWSHLKRIKLLGGEPFMSPNFLDFLYLIESRCNIPEVELELVTNCSMPMTKEIANILNKFKLVRLSGSFDGLPKHSEYQRVGSKFAESLMNFMDYGDLLHNRHMTVHQTFTVLNVNKIDAALEYYEPYCDTQSWSYDDWNFPFLNAPDWFEEWVLSENKNEKIKQAFSKRKYNHIAWHKILFKIKKFDEYYDTRLEDANPELAHMLKINTKKYVDAHERPQTRDCLYCDLVDEV